MNDAERRNLPQKVELRRSDTGPGTLTGYAAKFNRQSQNLGGFVEQIDPGAFLKSLTDKLSVVARYNHQDSALLGTTENGTLVLRSDATGLSYDILLPDTSAGRDVAVLAERGDLRYSSFAFRTVKDDWSLTRSGYPLRTLFDVQLVDVAPVNTPAYLDTSTGMRSLAAKLDIDPGDIKEMEPEEIRSRITGVEPSNASATQAPESVQLLRLRLLTPPFV